MKIKVKNISGLALPKFAREGDACLDIIATTDPIIVGEEVSKGLYKSIDYIEYGTSLYMTPQQSQEEAIGWNYQDNIKVYFLNDYFIELRPRSSISKYNLILANGPATGDKAYTGEYKVRFKYIVQSQDFVLIERNADFDSPFPSYQEIYCRINEEKIYRKGDKICQMRPCVQYPVEFELVDELEDTQRGSGGFGSSGT
jgi:dUTPase